MERIFYLSFLIFYADLFQVIASFSELNTNESSNLHIREKRLLNKSPNGNKPVSLESVPYIVNLIENETPVCAGSILLSNFVITAGHCILKVNATYIILSGSERRYDGIVHNIKEVFLHPLFDASKKKYDLALLRIYPHIDFKHSLNRRISLYNGSLLPGAKGLFSGWGCTHALRGEPIFPDELRSIRVSIFSQEKCYKVYKNITYITSREICTADELGEKGSCFGDSGGPFVIHDQLAGVMSWNKGYYSSAESPDVFTNVAYPSHIAWINLILKIFKKY